MSISVFDIVNYYNSVGIKNTFIGNERVKISCFCPLSDLKDDCVTWVRYVKDADVDKLNQYKNIILIAEYGEEIANANFPVIYAEEIDRAFFMMLEHFFHGYDPEPQKGKIERTAVVETSNIGENVYIGHHTFISADSKIGNNVIIMHNVTIEGKVSIGENTFIESGTVIGACGFGYHKDFEDHKKLNPHYAGVSIGSNVRIGANNTIIRGCLADTVIEDRVKTADLVCISHNCIIKEGAMLTCGTVIAGSTIIGRNVWCAPGTTFNNACKVDDESYIGIGSVVLNKVKQGTKVFGVPAKQIRF